MNKCLKIVVAVCFCWTLNICFAASSRSIPKHINDTGITTCSDANTNNLACPINDYPNQDAQSGRDVTKNSIYDGRSGLSFTKISAKGSVLKASATRWNCVKDNTTNLVWEVKTTNGDLHDQHNTYTWYASDNKKNGGSAGRKNGGVCFLSQCDSQSYVYAVNATKYCGYKDWRIPTLEELISIASLESNSLSIDVTYFPNTQNHWFWSSTPLAFNSDYAWGVVFNSGFSSMFIKSGSGYIRLVRG